MARKMTGNPIYRDTVIYQCPKCSRRTIIKENLCPNCGLRIKGDKNDICD